jgi:hypothetical protein
MEQDYHTFVMSLNVGVFHILGLSVWDVDRDLHVKMCGFGSVPKCHGSATLIKR